MIKLKSIIVILISSILISAVLIFTILGFSLYLGWKERDTARIHAIKISGLNADIYTPFLNIFDLHAKVGGSSIYEDKYLVEGTIKNAGFRTVSSVTLEVDFLNSSREIIHTEIVKPLGSSPPPAETNIAALSIFTSRRELPLAPGQKLRFKHILSSQKDKNVISPIKYDRFATNPNEWSGKFGYRITKVRF
jgi:hypothetical protein